MMREYILKAIKYDIDEHLRPNTIYITQVTQCLRRSYFEIVKPDKHVNEYLKRPLMRGKNVHYWIYELLKKYKDKLNINFEYEKEISFTFRGYKIVGRADIVLPSEVVEIKTSERGIRIPDEMHILQANEYAYRLYKPQFEIVYILPDDIIEFIFQTSKKKHLEFMKRLNTLISFIEVNRIPDAERGIWCNSCPYKTECFFRKLFK